MQDKQSQKECQHYSAVKYKIHTLLTTTNYEPWSEPSPQLNTWGTVWGVGRKIFRFWQTLHVHKYIQSNLLTDRRQLRAHAGGDVEAHSRETVWEHRYSTNAPWCECLSINPEGSLGNVECGKTNRSVLNQNRREQLPDTKLIPYLGLHKKSINTWKECNQKRNAREKKRFPRAKQKGAQPNQQHLQFHCLLQASWIKKQEVGPQSMCRCVIVCVCVCVYALGGLVFDGG